MTKAIVSVVVSVPLESDFADLEPKEAVESVRDYVEGVRFGKYPAHVTHASGTDLFAEVESLKAVEAAARLAKTELAHCVHVMKRGGGMYEEALVALRDSLAALDAGRAAKKAGG